MDVYATPELTNNPRHSVAAGRGTDKGGNSYPPEDNEGVKAQPIQSVPQESSLNMYSVRQSCINEALSTIGNRTQPRFGPENFRWPTLPQSTRSNAALYDAYQLTHRGTAAPKANSSDHPGMSQAEYIDDASSPSN